MKKSVVVIIHSLLWIILISFFGLINILSNPSAPLSIRIFNFSILTFFTFASIYLYYLYLFPAFFAKRKYVKFVLFSFLGGILISGITKLFTIFQNGSTTLSEDVFTIIFGSVGVIIIGQIGTLLRALIEWFDYSRRNEILEKQKLMAEISFLKSQINPHFMFNTLSNIDTLITENPQKASSSLLKLSTLFRYMVYETNKDTVLLEDEIAYLQDLVELQRIRLNNNESISFEVIGNTKERYIAPMLFVPFIENAFKHCSDKEASSAIIIRIDILEKSVKFYSENLYQEQKISKETSGVGLELVKKRLSLIYPNRHSLNISKINNTFVVDLEIENSAN